MELLKLRYFHAVAQLEHVTKAAELLHVSQPSLSQSIHSLEAQLGVELFVRQGRRLVLTRYGQHLKERLDALLPQFDALATEMATLKQEATHTVKLNILAASSFVINTIVEYQKQNTHATFDFEQSQLHNDCDILITTNGLSPETKRSPLHRYVKKESIFLAVPKTSAYAREEAVDLSCVQNESFVMLSSTRLFGALCNRFCAQAGFTPKTVFESDSPTAVQNMISIGAGVAFWPEHSWGKLQNQSLTLLPIARPLCQRELIVEHYQRQPNSLYAEDFYRFLIHTL